MSTSIPTEILPPTNPQGVVTTQQFHACHHFLPVLSSGTAICILINGAATSVQKHAIPPPPFNTLTKLHAVEEVMRDHPGTAVGNLRQLATGLMRDTIFGKKGLQYLSLSEKNMKLHF